ncbi:MAG: hypothetical protein F6K28_15715 [Microcoleus sp. SIO2G3]|nr:hypothetical protein [Microcoleus sp. SIO2G3]
MSAPSELGIPVGLAGGRVVGSVGGLRRGGVGVLIRDVTGFGRGAGGVGGVGAVGAGTVGVGALGLGRGVNPCAGGRGRDGA